LLTDEILTADFALQQNPLVIPLVTARLRLLHLAVSPLLLLLTKISFIEDDISTGDQLLLRHVQEPVAFLALTVFQELQFVALFVQLLAISFRMCAYAVQPNTRM